MKKVFVLCLILILLISCEDLEHTNPLHPDYPAELTIDKTEANVSNGSGSFTVKVTSNGNWTVSSAANWLTVSPNSGNNNGTITVNYTANSGEISREGIIVISNPQNMLKTCKVTQIANALNITPTTQNVPDDAGSFTVNVTSNVSWTVSSSASWLTVSPSSGSINRTITVNYTANTESSERSGTISVVGGGITRTCTITQSEFVPKLTISPETKNVSPSSGSFTVNVSSNWNWTVSFDANWLTTSPNSGNSNGTITVNYTANTETSERSGTLMVACGGITRICTINQFAPELTISPETKNVSSLSGSFTVNVTSNVDWTVNSSAIWLTVSPSSGNNNGTIIVNYTANAGIIDRSGSLTVASGRITRICKITQEGLYGMIFIQGGTFQMGSTAERPVHTVSVSDFYMSKYEVTQKLYDDVKGTNPSYFTGDNLPVELVSWYDAVEFCNALSEKEGLTPVYTIDKSRIDPNNESQYDDFKWIVIWDHAADGYRLPTEAEWEYAAGGGSSNRTIWAGTDSENSLSNYVWYSSNSVGKTHPVSTKEFNSLGLYDMSGNVWEWCWDWYSPSYYYYSPLNNPAGPTSGSDRVLRGGGWGSNATNCRVTGRFGYDPSYWSYSIGFRLVRNAE
jgi:formylglycine-generating enzyme required for sulfatase activity